MLVIMGFSLFGVAACVAFFFVPLEASPSSEDLSQVFDRKTSESTYCKEDTTHCEIVPMAESEESKDVAMESQDDSEDMDTSCKESGGQKEQTMGAGEGSKMDDGTDKVEGDGEKDEEESGREEGNENGGMKDEGSMEKKETTEGDKGEEESKAEGVSDEAKSTTPGGTKEEKGKEKKGKTGKKERSKRKEKKADDKVASKESKQEEDGEEEESLPPFPTTLDEFGYSFNDEGELRQKNTNEPFVFVVKEGNKRFNQAHYEALGEVITEHVYELLETEAKLQRVTIPVDARERDPKSFVFQSEDAATNQKLMVLIHGNGVVRAGQWARRLIINDCLNSGTQLPFIKRAKEEGYGVLVLNTNRNYDTVDGREKSIAGNSSPEEHVVYVWEHIIQKYTAKEVYIVAHSYGGVVITHLADVAKFHNVFQKHVKKIAFTDSVHNFEKQRTSSAVKRWMISHSRNWVSCGDPLDTELTSSRGKVQRVSAGTEKHEETSYCAMDSIFKYFKK